MVKAVQEQVADTQQYWSMVYRRDPCFQVWLHGAISGFLEIDTEVSPKIDVASIKEPKNGKKISREEFNKEREEELDERDAIANADTKR